MGCLGMWEGQSGMASGGSARGTRAGLSQRDNPDRPRARRWQVDNPTLGVRGRCKAMTLTDTFGRAGSVCPIVFARSSIANRRVACVDCGSNVRVRRIPATALKRTGRVNGRDQRVGGGLSRGLRGRRRRVPPWQRVSMTSFGSWLGRMVFSLLFAAALVVIALKYVPLLKSNQARRTETLKKQHQLALFSNQLRAITEENDRLRSDPKAIERAAREVLGYARPDEKIVTFPEAK